MSNQTNPNNCKTCNYKLIRPTDGGWCYMFRNEPKEPCAQHTGPGVIRMLPI